MIRVFALEALVMQNGEQLVQIQTWLLRTEICCNFMWHWWDEFMMSLA